MMGQTGLAVVEQTTSEEGPEIGDVVMGADGEIGEVEQVVGDLVICRLLSGGEGPVVVCYCPSDVTVIREPRYVLSVEERIAIGSMADQDMC